MWWSYISRQHCMQVQQKSLITWNKRITWLLYCIVANSVSVFHYSLGFTSISLCPKWGEVHSTVKSLTSKLAMPLCKGCVLNLVMTTHAYALMYGMTWDNLLSYWYRFQTLATIRMICFWNNIDIMHFQKIHTKYKTNKLHVIISFSSSKSQLSFLLALNKCSTLSRWWFQLVFVHQ